MDSIEFTLQLLSTIFTVLGVIVAVSSMDTRWSLAAVLGRRIQGRNIDWEGERRRWREMHDIENQGALLDRNQYEDHGEPEDIDPSSRTWSALSDATIAVKEYTKFNVELDDHDQESDTKVNSTALKTLNNRQPIRPQQSQHDRQRKPRLVMWPCGRRSGAREATTSKAPVYVNSICTTAA